MGTNDIPKSRLSAALRKLREKPAIRGESTRPKSVEPIPIEDMLHFYMGAFELYDRAMMENILSENFVYTSPDDHEIDRKAYLDKYWGADTGRAVFIERVLSEGNQAFVHYCVERSKNLCISKVAFMTFSLNKIETMCVFVGAEVREELCEEVD